MARITEHTDLQLLEAMAAKLLRDEHQLAPSLLPKMTVLPETRTNGSTDVRVGFPVARGLELEIRQHWYADGQPLELLVDAATELADNVAAAHGMRSEIAAMVAEVRRAAAGAIAKAKRRGLHYRLLSVTPVVGYDRVADGVGTTVEIEALSIAARPERSTFGADCAEDVAETFKGMKEEQERRAEMRHYLDARGAMGRIDGVVVNALRRAGYEIGPVLSMLGSGCGRTVDLRGEGAERFTLYWKDGDVFANVPLGDGCRWFERRLSFDKAPIEPADAKGRYLKEAVSDPVFADGLWVCGSYGTKGGYGSLFCIGGAMLFNSDTGALWAD